MIMRPAVNIHSMKTIAQTKGFRRTNVPLRERMPFWWDNAGACPSFRLLHFPEEHLMPWVHEGDDRLKLSGCEPRGLDARHLLRTDQWVVNGRDFGPRPCD